MSVTAAMALKGERRAVDDSTQSGQAGLRHISFMPCPVLGTLKFMSSARTLIPEH